VWCRPTARRRLQISYGNLRLVLDAKWDALDAAACYDFLMPSLNLRLSEEELEQLRQWAYGSRRSLQREIVFRLFEGLALNALNTSSSDGYTVPAGTNPPPNSGAARSTPAPEASSGKCTAYAPRGTRCKLCGKTHS